MSHAKSASQNREGRARKLARNFVSSTSAARARKDAPNVDQFNSQMSPQTECVQSMDRPGRVASRAATVLESSTACAGKI